ncbi:N-acetylglucosaminidase [Aeribacillus composti]|uniref:N-acetylglucosaminidase n=2 Tax=Aeribacillus TaxID=1055323 RepID=A0ABY9WCD4_9BACI|nr:N-acetylglucosaminidase [Aeribacillus composti]WNF33613.1 N-acetylglucosaminidase [Aeribacillus composti]
MRKLSISCIVLLILSSFSSAVFADQSLANQNNASINNESEQDVNSMEQEAINEGEQDLKLPDQDINSENESASNNESILDESQQNIRSEQTNNIDENIVEKSNNIDSHAVKNEENEEQQEKDETVKETVENKSSIKMGSFSISQTADSNVVNETATSKLGHIKTRSVKIYKNLNDFTQSFEAGEEYTNRVYYIKKQASVNGEQFYLLSLRASSTIGVVGWAKASDISSHDHKTIDSRSKLLYIKGTGSAYSKAWGGKKDLVYEDLSQFKNQKFQVDLTETVGNNVWYRGWLNGEKVFIHSSYVSLESVKESATSKLGHIRTREVKIYKTLGDPSTAFTSGAEYTNRVYYIKKQATMNGELYYLLSLQPSSTSGLVGWVNEKDMSVHPHTSVDKKSKVFFIKGTGSAYSKAWGGKKDLVYEDLSQFKNQKFQVDLTETVGNNVWYRGWLNGKKVFIHSSYVTNAQETATSKLGHIRTREVKIYKILGDPSTAFTSGAEYTNRVYYIKKQATMNGELYYLLSLQPSSTSGLVGWVNEKDMSVHPHTSVDKKSKVFFIKGTGSAYSKAWGGKKDLVYENLSQYKNQKFQVDLTETVGNNVWYRGWLNGKKVFIHSSYVTNAQETATSKLGHIRTREVKIYKTLGDPSTSFTSGAEYTNQVYYIKKQATVNGQLYYLLSLQPSSTSGLVGWVKEEDMSVRTHSTVDKKSKVFFVKGTGSAYNKAWGGKKNLVYEDLSQYETNLFRVHLTEKVGNNTWYRGTLDGKTVWIHSSFLYTTLYKNYNITLDEMVNIQMKANPVTDKYGITYKLWIREDAFEKIYTKNGQKYGLVKDANWKIRRGPSTSYPEYEQVRNVELPIYGSAKSEDNDGKIWYHVKNTRWGLASKADVKYYLDPNNFTNDLRGLLQFLKLSASANLNAAEINNKILYNKGILKGKASSFIEAGQKYGINEIYLISHALLETGNGTSALANGIKYNGKTVYNMYGIGAYDNCAVECGVKRAYDEGWFTPEKAIVGGAKFIAEKYVYDGRDTLYKMRWDPDFADVNKRYGKQYATDIGWAYKQTASMYNMYKLLDSYTLVLEIPEYKK